MSLGLSAVSLPESKPEVRRYFFDVSVLKLVLMSFATLGLYQIYWFYKNWELAKQRGQDVWPFARAIFAIFFVIPLFRQIQEMGRSTSVAVTTRAGSLGALFIIVQFAWRLPDPFWIIGFAGVLPLAVAQSDIVKIHRALGLDPTINNRFTWLNIVAIVFGGILFVLAVIGAFLPNTPA